MGLSNQQIERYSRQIIVPGVGGIAQEHLLASRLSLAGNSEDIAPVLAYMVGAGVGHVDLHLSDENSAAADSMVRKARVQNPDVAVSIAAESAQPDLIFAIIGDTSFNLRAIADTRAPLIVVRLIEPVCIAILPNRPPCPLCADTDLFAGSLRRGENAGFIAMVAATEAFRLLARIAPEPSPLLMSFDVYGCVTRPLRCCEDAPKCACTGIPKGH